MYFIAVSQLYNYDATADYVRAQAALLIPNGYKVKIITQQIFSKEIFDIEHPENINKSDIDEKNDVLIIHFGIFDIYLEKLMNLPFKKKILYFHNVTPHFHYISDLKYSNLLKESWLQLISFLPKFDKLLANSSFTIDQALAHSYNINYIRNWSVLPPRINSISKEYSPSKTNNKNYKQLVILGRIVEHKNVENGIQIFKELLNFDKDYKLIIIGKKYETDYFNYIKQLIENCDQISLKSDITYSERNQLLAESGATLNLSSHEGYALPVFESIFHETLPFYGTSEWLISILEIDALRIGVDKDYLYAAYKIDRTLSDKKKYSKYMEYLKLRVKNEEKLSDMKFQLNAIVN